MGAGCGGGRAGGVPRASLAEVVCESGRTSERALAVRVLAVPPTDPAYACIIASTRKTCTATACCLGCTRSATSGGQLLMVPTCGVQLRPPNTTTQRRRRPAAAAAACPG
jgi:hypothetical protein